MRKRRLLIAAGAVLVLVAIIPAIQLYDLLAVRAKFARVQVGMTPSEVQDILGRPAWEANTPNDIYPHPRGDLVARQGWDCGDTFIEVAYDKEFRVTNKFLGLNNSRRPWLAWVLINLRRVF
jgi:hypothetical protein